MKPKIKIIEKLYWDCGDERHHHKTEEVAARCMEKRAKNAPLLERRHSKRMPYKQYKLHPADRMAVFIRVVHGESIKSIASEIGISTTRIYQLRHKQLRKNSRLSRNPAIRTLRSYNMEQSLI